MVGKRTFKEWWNNLPEYLKEASKKVVLDETDSYKKSIKKVNYILIELNSYSNFNHNNSNNYNSPTLDESKFMLESGQIFD